MSRIVILDTGVVSLLVHVNRSAEIDQCRLWIETLLATGDTVMLSELVDYELRRKLIYIGSSTSVARLDALYQRFTYLPVTRETWRTAAELGAAASHPQRLSPAIECVIMTL